MNTIYFIELYEYNFWNNQRLWACFVQMSETEIRQPIDSDGWTLFRHCLHIISVEDWWIRFLQTGEVKFLKRQTLTTRAALRQQWDATEAMVRGYVAALSKEELQREVRPPFWDDDQFYISVEQALTQVAFHSTDHRAQMFTHMRNLGGPTVEQDFLQYLRAQQGKAAR